MSFTEAKDLMKSKRYHEADKLFKVIIKSGKPVNWETYYSYGNCLYELKNYKEAIENYEKSLQQNREFQDIIELKIGECFRFLKEYNQAISYYEKVIVRDTRQKRYGLYYKSLCLFDNKEYKKSLDILREYKKIIPPNEEYKPLVDMGLCCMQLKDYNQAYLILSDCVKNNNILKYMDSVTKPKCYILLAQVCKDLFKYKDAINYFNKVETIAIDKDNRLLNIPFSNYYACKFTECIQLGDNLLKSYHDKTDKDFQLIYIYVGNAYFFGKQNKDKAIDTHSKYTGDIYNYDYLCEKAKFNLAIQEWDTAEKLLAIFTKEKYIPGLLLLGSLYRNQKKTKEMDATIDEINVCSSHHKTVIIEYNTYINTLGFPFLCIQGESEKNSPKKISKEKPQEIIIGQGGFGKVILTELNGMQVVIKSLIKTNIIEEEKKLLIQSFQNERQLFLALDHKNIVKYYGFANEHDCMLEYCVGGDLRKLLSNKSQMKIDFKYHLINQIANGLSYLHSKEIIHGDMKGQNILLDNHYNYNMTRENYPNIKICDFGLGKKPGMAGLSGFTPRFAAPELITDFNSIITNKVDIFAFGMIIYEIITDELPFHEELDINKVIEMIKVGQLPTLNKLEFDWKEGNGPKIIEIMQKCWSYDPNKRPSMYDICRELSKII